MISLQALSPSGTRDLDHARRESEAERNWWARLHRQPIQRMLVVAGAVGKPTDGKAPLQRAPEDQELVSRIRHTMKPGEKLIQWYARVGLGKSQIMTMTKSEITRAVELAEERAKDDTTAPEQFLARPRPAKFFIQV